jgi:hypothetical protein
MLRLRRLIRLRATAAVVFLGSTIAAIAQDAVSARLHLPKLSGSIEVAVADRYIYHGYVAEDRGPVVQPYLYLEGQFYTGTGWLSSASVVLSIFNSLQFHHEGIRTQNEMLRTWYEAQFEPGVSLVFAEALTLSARYVRLESPNGAFVAGNAVTIELELDDERWLGAFALHPRFLWFTPITYESDPEGEKGHYFEAGITPGVTIAKNSAYPISLSFPVTIGFGDQHYFLGERFGFVSAGVTASVPLAFVPKEFGSWSVSSSALYYRLGRAPAEFSTGGEPNKSVFSAAFATEF